MANSYDPNLTWWKKDGVWDWWTWRNSRNQPQGPFPLWTSDGPILPIPMPPGSESATNTSSSSRDDGGGAGGGVGGELGEGDIQGRIGQFQFDTDNEANSPQPDIGEGGSADSSDAISAANALVAMGEAGKNSIGDVVEDVNGDAGDMTYQCDDSLGSGLNPTDCEKLSWSGLMPPDSIETLQPGVPKFYTQGSYYVGPP